MADQKGAPVVVEARVLRGLEAVRGSAALNMLDRLAVVGWLKDHGFFPAAEWILTHRTDYHEGIMRGFAARTGQDGMP